MVGPRKICSVWQRFHEESNSKVVCHLCMQKLTYHHWTGVMRNHIQPRHLDVNRQGERAPTSKTLQTSNVITSATPTHVRCDADRSEKITQLITEMTARNLPPLCVAEGKGLHQLKQYIKPEYMMPTVTSVIPVLQIFKCYFVLSWFLCVLCTDCQ